MKDMTESEAKDFIQFYCNNKSTWKHVLQDEFVEAVGFIPAAFLQYLMNKHNYFSATKQLVSHKSLGDGFFYFTIEDASKYLHLTREQQDTCIKALKDKGLIEVITMGMPPRRHFRISFINIAKILESSNNHHVPDLWESHKLICGKDTNAFVGNPHNASLYKINTKDIKKENTKVFSKEKFSGDDFSQKQHNIYSQTYAANAAASPNGDAQTSSSSSKPKEIKIKRCHNVATSASEHDKLLSNDCAGNEHLLKEAYEFLSLWKESASPSKVKAHSSDYYRMKRWVIKEVQDNHVRGSKLQIAKHRQGSKMVTPGDYEPDTFRRPRL
jgi:hypothetical protein